MKKRISIKKILFIIVISFVIYERTATVFIKRGVAEKLVSSSVDRGDSIALNEEGCRADPEYISIGTYIRKHLIGGGEKEMFIFKECIQRTAKYQNCEEIVELSPAYGSSQFPIECRCCYDENYNPIPLEL